MSLKYSDASFQLLPNLNTNLQMRNSHSDVQGSQTKSIDGHLQTDSPPGYFFFVDEQHHLISTSNFVTFIKFKERMLFK